MSIKFNFNVTKKIVVNGKEYASVDQIPENLRHLFDSAISRAGSGADPVVSRSSSLKISFNGKEYSGMDEMPDNVRRLYDMAMGADLEGIKESGTSLTRELIEAMRLSGDEKISFFRRLFPRTFLKWMEPAEIRKALYENKKRRFSSLLPVIIIGAVVVIWMLSRNAGFTEVLRLYLVAGFCIGVVFLIFWMGKVVPVEVAVTDTGIVRGSGDSATVWKYKKIERCEIATVTAGAQTHSVLVIHLQGGRRSVVGIEPSVSLDNLRLLLECKGVKAEAGSKLESLFLSANSGARLK